jgi:hypothetical protein
MPPALFQDFDTMTAPSFKLKLSVQIRICTGMYKNAVGACRLGQRLYRVRGCCRLPAFLRVVMLLKKRALSGCLCNRRLMQLVVSQSERPGGSHPGIVRGIPSAL